MNWWGKLAVRIFMGIIIVAFLAVCVNMACDKLSCGARKIPSLLSILGADLPERSERVEAVSVVSGKVTLSDSTIAENSPTMSPVAISLLPDSVVLPVEIVTIVMPDTVLVTAKVGGVPVRLKEQTYIRQVSSWERWRFTLSGIPALREPIDIDFCGGIAYRILRIHRIWAGLGLSVDLPDFGWAGAGVRGGWMFSDHGSLDAEIGYSVGDRDGLYFSLGGSFSF